MTDQEHEFRRLRQEYARREEDLETKGLYSSKNPAYQWMISDRHKKILSLINSKLKKDLSDADVLEIGCGTGGVIKEFLDLGVIPSRTSGVDLLLDRLIKAKTDLPDCSWVNGNGQYLPYRNQTFDLLLQFTAFSSILESDIKADMAKEMLRVLKPGGGIIWYDFIWNPSNLQTRGIGLNEVKTLFAGCEVFSLRVTLAPPLTRHLLPRFPRLVDLLSSLKILNSHLLVWIEKSI